MGLESATLPKDLVDTNPTASDSRREGDDHLRLIKTVIKNWAKDLDGQDPTSVNGAASSMMDAIFPIGGIILTLDIPASSPSDFIGGTWVKQGTFAVDNVIGGTLLDTVGGNIAVYHRTA
jgi:hypothetical protein